MVGGMRADRRVIGREFVEDGMGQTREFDVAIIGGGPGGSTCATLLKKYNASLRVAVIEKEVFPREHIGESQLPVINPILSEMGVWEKVEAANFPIKIGAAYTWGKNLDRWDFDFYPAEKFVDEPRPASYAGQRLHTAFQVDRDRYDQILLEHARGLGAEVLQPALVRDVSRENGSVAGLTLDDGTTIKARHYVDSSGQVGLLRRALEIGVWAPNELRNIAIWEYWENAEWAVEIGVGGTRVLVRSLPYGWMWFIPLGPTRTSIGLICPADHYKSMGMSPEELYYKAIGEQEDISRLTKNAKASGEVRSCKDWSQLADKIAGENWFIIGDAAGFADPILAAGMSLTHTSAHDCAYTILELERGEHDRAWLRKRFEDRNRNNVKQHIRFAQYWYSANSCFTDLREHCQNLAKEAGLKLSPQDAWRWISQGGFSLESDSLPTFAGFDLGSTKQLLEKFDAQDRSSKLLINGHNVFKLNLKGATKGHFGQLQNGRITKIPCYDRGTNRLPLTGQYDLVVQILERAKYADEILAILDRVFDENGLPPEIRRLKRSQFILTIELMVENFWIDRSIDKKRPLLEIDLSDSHHIRLTSEGQRAVEESGSSTHKFNI